MTKNYWYQQFSKRGITKGRRSMGEYEAAKTVVKTHILTPDDYERAIRYAAEYVGV